MREGRKDLPDSGNGICSSAHPKTKVGADEREFLIQDAPPQHRGSAVNIVRRPASKPVGRADEQRNSCKSCLALSLHSNIFGEAMAQSLEESVPRPESARRLLHMRQHIKYLVLALLMTALGPMALHAQSDSQTFYSPHTTLVGITEFDFGLPEGNGLRYPLSLGGNLVAGCQVNRLLTLGIGAGLQGYGPSDMLLIPVFADARLHFQQKKWTPYLALDIGYAFSLDTAARGGFLFNPSVGGRFPMTNNTALVLGLGLRVQQNRAWVDGTLVDHLPNYLSAKIGFVFKAPRLSRRVFAKTIGRRMRDKSKRDNG